MRASFEAGKDMKVGAPRFLFDMPVGSVEKINPTPDGQFVLIQPEPEAVNPLEVVVVPTFLQEIRTRVRFRETR
jgi:hypothetical protein